MAAEGRSGKTAALVLVPTAVLVAVVMLALRMRIEPPTVPPYRIAASDGASASSTAVLRPGDKLALTLEPVGQLTGAITGRAFLIQGRQVRNVEPDFLVDRDGTIHVAGDVGKLFAGVAPGQWELAIAVGRPETLPRTPADVLRASDADAGGVEAAWVLVREAVRIGG
jgi:hypothetical protein